MKGTKWKKGSRKGKRKSGEAKWAAQLTEKKNYSFISKFTWKIYTSKSENFGKILY